MIKAIIFDIGGVVAKETVETIWKGIFDIIDPEINVNECMEKIRPTIYEFARGKYSKREFFELINDTLNLEMSPEDLENVWNKSYQENSETDTEVVEIIKHLKENGYRLAILSDIEELYLNARKKYMADVLDLFDVTVFSNEVKYKKPEREIYEIVLERIGVPPENCVFIDDRSENTEAAKELCIKTILFKNAEQLRTELKQLGVELQ